MKYTYYFGYGSNLNQEFLRQYCPSAEFVMKAFLPNYEVQFRFWSKKRNGGISSIIEMPGELVHGVIYKVLVKELLELDILESVPQGFYKREAFLVLGGNGEWQQADLCRVADSKGPFPPAKSYVDQMFTGAKQHGLDPDYIKKIEGFYKHAR